MRWFRPLGALALLLLPVHPPAWLDVLSRPPLVGPLTVLRGTIGRNGTLASTLAGTLSPAGVQRLVEAARPVYDLARLSVGRPFGLALDPDGILLAFTYGVDDLRTLRVSREGKDLRAELVTLDYDLRTDVVSGTIESSLFEAVTGEGEQDQLALDLADIFAWDVDFNTEIQPGDSFRVVVEKMSLDGRFLRYGRILAAEFARGERFLRAVRFEGAGGTGYYAPDGTPLRKAFLRSPLKFSRISSRFSRSRLHPILHARLPHLGVDYAAPLGTPVLAAANGIVASAGWSGGYGNAVRLRHANGFETLYGHLSRIDVRVGQRVAQGTRLGAVGATGLATGPHLDYRMARNGVFVDPLRVRSPPAEPLPQGERPAFAAARAASQALLERGPAPARMASAAISPGRPAR